MEWSHNKDEEARKEKQVREGVEDLKSLEGIEVFKEEDGFVGVISKTESLLERELNSDSPILASTSLSPISL